MLLYVEEEDHLEQAPATRDEEKYETEPQDLELHISLNTLKETTWVGPIKFVGHIGNTPIQILVDRGSLDNFLQPRIAHFLKLDFEPAPIFKVLVGNGNSLTSEGSI